MPQSFKLYRIICTINDRALVYGSDWPHGHLRSGQWYDRGQWSLTSGSFWKTEAGVRNHLQNLCHDWRNRRSPDPDDYRSWMERTSTAADWTRLDHLRVEQILVTKYSTVQIPAHDFMGIPETQAA